MAYPAFLWRSFPGLVKVVPTPAADYPEFGGFPKRGYPVRGKPRISYPGGWGGTVVAVVSKVFIDTQGRLFQDLGNNVLLPL